MQLSRFWIAAAIAGATPIVAAAPAQADEAEDIGYEWDRVLRGGARYVDEPQYLDAEQAAETLKKLEDVLARLEKAKPGAPKVAEAKKALEEYRAKAEQASVTLVKKAFEQEQKSYKRQLDQFQDPENLGSEAAERFTQTATDTLARMRKLLDEGRPRLTSAAGKAFIDEAEKWIAESQKTIAFAGRVAEARRLINNERYETRDIGDVRFVQALKLIDSALDDENPERALQAWDAAKKLVKAVQDPRFADLDEVKAILEQYKKAEARVAAELTPMLAKVRVGPLVEAAKFPLGQLNEAVDNKNKEAALEARAKLRLACVELRREWKDVADAKALLAEADKAIARSDEELGDGLAIAEIEVAEKDVKPALERLVRALDRKNATQVRRYAPLVRSRMDGLRPFADKSRAKGLLDRCDQALARLEKEMGASIKKQIEEEEAWPKVEIDYNAPSEVQQTCIDINEHVARMREGMLEKQARYEDIIGDMDAKHLQNDHLFNGVASDVEDQAKSLVRAARDLEKKGPELAKLDPKNPGVGIISSAVPKLIKRANAWKELVAKKCEYAGKLSQAVRYWEGAQEGVSSAREGDAERATSGYGWPAAIDNLDKMMVELQAAMKVLPDDKDEADEWAAKAKPLRAEAEKGFIDACFSGASEAAIAGDEYKAKQFGEAMKRTLPKSPENERVAKIIAGGADARAKCESEVKSRDDLLSKRAVESSQAMRERFDSWRTEKAPQVLLAGTILGNLGKWKGKFVEGKYDWLGEGFYDDFLEINGEIYKVSYAPEVRAGCEAAAKKLRGLHDQMVAAVIKKAGVPFTYTRGYYPKDAEFVCEITGATSYTPVHQVKDQGGSIIGSVTGTPYMVPQVVIKGVFTKYYAVFPGGASIDGLNAEGVLP